MKRIMAGIAVLTVAIAFALPAVAAKKKANKPVQAQTSSCSKCDKKKAAKRSKKDCKNCNKPNCNNCNETKDGKPCPTDCPKKSK